MGIKCCEGCVPLTRYPGCHAKCEQYKAEKAEYEKQKEHAKVRKTAMLTNYDLDEIVAYTCSKCYKRRNRE